jgi:hypothetical protein
LRSKRNGAVNCGLGKMVLADKKATTGIKSAPPSPSARIMLDNVITYQAMPKMGRKVVPSMTTGYNWLQTQQYAERAGVLECSCEAERCGRLK